MSSSDPINANPTVLDISALPKRQDTENDDHTSSKKVDGSVWTPLGIFSREIVTPSIWKQYHEQDLDYYSVIDSDPESSNYSSSSSEVGDEEELTEPDDNSTEEETRKDPIDPQEIYDLISIINDPEHPLTLGQLAVVNLPDIEVEDPTGLPDEIAHVRIQITPTITHCSLATLIGLGIRVRLERALPPRFRIHITVKPGSHQSEKQVNKQLNDKERVAAACENVQLLGVISNMLSNC